MHSTGHVRRIDRANEHPDRCKRNGRDRQRSRPFTQREHRYERRDHRHGPGDDTGIGRGRQAHSAQQKDRITHAAGRRLHDEQ